MKTIQKDSFPKETNAFLNDGFHMGQSMGWSPNGNLMERVSKGQAMAGMKGSYNAPAGSRIMVMFPCHDSEVCDYILIVDEATGEVLKVQFSVETDEVFYVKREKGSK